MKPFLEEIFVAACCFRVKEESARIWRVNEKGKERKRKRKTGKTEQPWVLRVESLS